MSQRLLDSTPSTAHSRSPIGSSEDTKQTGRTRSSKSRRPAVSYADLQVNIRYTTTILVLFTMGLICLLAQRLSATDSTVVRVAGSIIALVLGLFLLEWNWTHGGGLTRQKRAHFDEANILETYQPRARTHGHLFLPDPPTPGSSVKIKDAAEVIERSDDEKALWNATRDAHYTDMFNTAMRVAKEQEMAEKMTAAPSTSQSPRLPKRRAPSPPKETDNQSGVPELTAEINGGQLPAARRPPARKRLQTAAQSIAQKVKSRVQTALDKKSLRGSLPSSASDSSTRTAISSTPKSKSPKSKPKDKND